MKKLNIQMKSKNMFSFNTKLMHGTYVSRILTSCVLYLQGPRSAFVFVNKSCGQNFTRKYLHTCGQIEFKHQSTYMCFIFIFGGGGATLKKSKKV